MKTFKLSSLPPQNRPEKGTKVRGGKRKDSAKEKQTTQTKKQPTVLPQISNDEQPTVEPSTKKSSRKRIDVPTDAQRSGMPAPPPPKATQRVRRTPCPALAWTPYPKPT